VIGIDVSATLIRLAREEDPKGKYFHAPASCMPLEDACADLAIAFMTLQDVDDLEPSVLEIARVRQTGGRACLAIVLGRQVRERGGGQRIYHQDSFWTNIDTAIGSSAPGSR
jgi:ubiquinone/menaquinone biosynthesis C-methylase UbiE